MFQSLCEMVRTEDNLISMAGNVYRSEDKCRLKERTQEERHFFASGGVIVYLRGVVIFFFSPSTAKYEMNAHSV